mgnify:CR=1 FL=1
MNRFRILVIGACLLLAGSAVAQTEITLARFFGACEQASTDVANAVGEACIIQSIINAYSAADNDVTVNTLPTDWGNYYDQLKAMYAAGNAPDVHVIHKHAIPEFASLGALADLTDDLAAAGIDVDDWTESGLAAASHDGRIYAVPLDVHANLWYVNMDIMSAAGLVADDGTPVLPSSPEELLEQAAAVKEATGMDYLAADFSEFPIGVRLVLALVWQQDSELFADGEANVDSDAAKRAVQTIVDLFDGGYADPTLNYNDSMQAFMDGEAAVLVNGDWVVNSLDDQIASGAIALESLYIADFPTLFSTPATWADSHTWAVPSTLKASDPEKYAAALDLLAWIYDNGLEWSRTGHLSISRDVVASDAYAALPHRSEFANTVNIARDVQPTVRYDAIQDVLNRALHSIWLTGVSIDDALSAADAEVQDLLD